MTASAGREEPRRSVELAQAERWSWRRRIGVRGRRVRAVIVAGLLLWLAVLAGLALLLASRGEPGSGSGPGKLQDRIPVAPSASLAVLA